MTWLDRIHVGDCRDLMRRMRDDEEGGELEFTPHDQERPRSKT